MFLDGDQLKEFRDAASDSLRGKLRDRVLQVAAERLDWEIPREPPPVPPVRNSWRHSGNEFQGIDEEHGRMYQEHYRTAMLIRNMTELFAFSHMVSNDDRFLRRASQWMLFPCSWQTWGAYAASTDPLGAYTLQDLETLARSGGEVVEVKWNEVEETNYPVFEDSGIFTTFKLRGLAIAYDWLKDRLDETVRAEVHRVLIREGARLYRAAAQGRGLLIHRMLNHTWMDVAAFGITALVLIDEHHEATDWAQLARDKFASSLLPDALGRDGEFPEPPACVWEYALMNGVMFLEALRHVTGDDLFADPNMRKLPRFLLKTMDPHRGFTFDEEMTFDDAEGNIYGLRPVVLRLASEYGDAEAQWLALQDELQAPGSDCGKYYPGGPWFPRTREYNGHWELIWLDPSLKPHRPTATGRSTHLRDAGWVIMGNGWDSRDTFLAFKSGPYLGPHDKLDQNKFVLSAHGERLVEKFHLDCYSRADFFRRTVGNSTLLVDGQGQDSDRDGLISHSRVAVEYKRESRSGRIIGFEDAEEHCWAVGDATAAYRGLSRFHRYVIFLKPDLFVILDDIKSQDGRPKRYDWLLHTKGNIALGENQVSIEKNEATLDVAFLLPQSCTFELIESPPDFDGRTWNYLAARPAAEEGQQHFLALLDTSSASKPAEVLRFDGSPEWSLELRTNDAHWFLSFDLQRQSVAVRRAEEHGRR